MERLVSSRMTDLIVVGKVLKPRGLKGEVKIQVMINKTDVFFAARKVIVGKKTYKIVTGSVQGEFAYCCFEGINSVEAAEQLRGLFVQIERIDLKLADDEILATDLIGFEVKSDNGLSYGIIKDIENYGGGDIVVTEQCSFPYEDDFVIETNMSDKSLIIRANMLLEEEV